MFTTTHPHNLKTCDLVFQQISDWTFRGTTMEIVMPDMQCHQMEIRGTREKAEFNKTFTMVCNLFA
jgi:hypothetical protein